MYESESIKERTSTSDGYWSNTIHSYSEYYYYTVIIVFYIVLVLLQHAYFLIYIFNTVNLNKCTHAILSLNFHYTLCENEPWFN